MRRASGSCRGPRAARRAWSCSARKARAAASDCARRAPRDSAAVDGGGIGERGRLGVVGGLGHDGRKGCDCGGDVVEGGGAVAAGAQVGLEAGGVGGQSRGAQGAGHALEVVGEGTGGLVVVAGEAFAQAAHVLAARGDDAAQQFEVLAGVAAHDGEPPGHVQAGQRGQAREGVGVLAGGGAAARWAPGGRGRRRAASQCERAA